MKPIWTGIPGPSGKVTIYIPKLIDQKTEVFARKYEKIKQRRAGQYAYLFGYIYSTIADRMGYSVDLVTKQAKYTMMYATHEKMKKMLNPVIKDVLIFTDSGLEIDTEEITGSTTKLSCKGLANFTERVKAFWSTEYGLEFPDKCDDWILMNQRAVDNYYGRV